MILKGSSINKFYKDPVLFVGCLRHICRPTHYFAMKLIIVKLVDFEILHFRPRVVPKIEFFIARLVCQLTAMVLLFVCDSDGH